MERKRSRSPRRLVPPVFSQLNLGLQLLFHNSKPVCVVLKKIKLSEIHTVHSEQNPPEVPKKYWVQRYSLFSKFDEGIQLDTESWYSVTQEEIAAKIAKTCEDADLVLDAFAGAGGNVIQFAKNSSVIAVDIDPHKLELLKNNSKVYQVEHKVQCLEGDFLEVGKTLESIDVVFMSPPWGGPEYCRAYSFDLKGITPSIYKVASVCSELTRNLIIYFPRNINPSQVFELLEELPNFERKVEFHAYYRGNKFYTVACFIGDLVHPDTMQLSKLLIESTQGKYQESELMQALEIQTSLEQKGFNATCECYLK